MHVYKRLAVHLISHAPSNNTGCSTGCPRVLLGWLWWSPVQTNPSNTISPDHGVAYNVTRSTKYSGPWALLGSLYRSTLCPTLHSFLRFSSRTKWLSYLILQEQVCKMSSFDYYGFLSQFYFYNYILVTSCSSFSSQRFLIKNLRDSLRRRVHWGVVCMFPLHINV